MEIIVGHLFVANTLRLLQLLQFFPFLDQAPSSLVHKLLHSVILLVHLLDLEVFLPVLLLQLVLLLKQELNFCGDFVDEYVAFPALLHQSAYLVVRLHVCVH